MTTVHLLNNYYITYERKRVVRLQFITPVLISQNFYVATREQVIDSNWPRNPCNLQQRSVAAKGVDFCGTVPSAIYAYVIKLYIILYFGCLFHHFVIYTTDYLNRARDLKIVC